METAQFKVIDLLKKKEYSGSLEYTDLYGLSESIEELILEGTIPCETVYLTLPDGKTYKWEPGIARYVYAKGRMSEEEFIDYTFLLTEKEYHAKWLNTEEVII
jgi:hypothetical protein